MIENTLMDAQQLISAGEVGEARQRLARLLTREPGNATAWLWLADCLEAAEEKRFCLEKALALGGVLESDPPPAIPDEMEPTRQCARAGVTIPAAEEEPARPKPKACALRKPNLAGAASLGLALGGWLLGFGLLAVSILAGRHLGIGSLWQPGLAACLAWLLAIASGLFALRRRRPACGLAQVGILLSGAGWSLLALSTGALLTLG